MKLTEQQLIAKIDGYLVELIGKLATPLGKFKVGFVRPILPGVLRPYLATMTQMGMADAEGIDIDALERCVMAGFDAGKKIDLYGLVFDQDEARQVFSFIRK